MFTIVTYYADQYDIKPTEPKQRSDNRCWIISVLYWQTYLIDMLGWTMFKYTSLLYLLLNRRVVSADLFALNIWLFSLCCSIDI